MREARTLSGVGRPLFASGNVNLFDICDLGAKVSGSTRAKIVKINAVSQH